MWRLGAPGPLLQRAPGAPSASSLLLSSHDGPQELMKVCGTRTGKTGALPERMKATNKMGNAGQRARRCGPRHTVRIQCSAPSRPHSPYGHEEEKDSRAPAKPPFRWPGSSPKMSEPKPASLQSPPQAKAPIYTCRGALPTYPAATALNPHQAIQSRSKS